MNAAAVSALCAAVLGPVAVVIAAAIGRKKLDAIHVLVNNRLTEALDEIKALKLERDTKASG